MLYEEHKKDGTSQTVLERSLLTFQWLEESIFLTMNLPLNRREL